MTHQTFILNKPVQPAAAPKTRGLPVVGALPNLVRNPLAYLEAAREIYGDIYHLNLGLASAIMVNHPRHAEHVLINNVRNYPKAGPMWESFRTFLGNGLGTSEGDVWLRQRRMIQPQFHRKRLNALTDLMMNAIDEGMSTWDHDANVTQPANQTPFNIGQAFENLTMKVILAAMFSTSLNQDAIAQMGDDMGYALDYIIVGMMTQSLPDWLPVPGRRRYRAALSAIDARVYAIAEARKALAEKPHDMLTMLLDVVDAETGAGMSMKQLRDEVVTFFLAGYETTAGALEWSMHFLTQQPEFATKVQAEVDSVVGTRTPTFEDAMQLTYTRKVIQEALRIYGAAYWIPRQAVEDDEIDGYRIPAGSTIGVIVHNIHRHPEVWANPTVFDPERHTKEAAAQRHRLAWMPFGAGQHQCIGKELSLLESVLILARIMQRYNAFAVPGRVAQPKIATSLRSKDGVWVRLEKRG